MKKLTLLSAMLTFGAMASHAANYYWIGGTGQWNDISHWATASGGSTNHSIVPSASDNVFFDANSGLNAGTIVSLPTTGHAYCNNITWNGVTAATTFRNQGSFGLYISGNMELASSVAYGMMRFFFVGTGNATFKTNGAARINAAGWYNPFGINKPGGSLTLLDDIGVPLAVSNIVFDEGSLDLSGHNHTFGGLVSNNTGTRSLNINNSNITAAATWDYRGNNKNLNSTNSYINAYIFNTDSLSYPKVDIIRVSGNEMIINNTTFGQLTFTSDASLPGTVRIGGGNTISKLEFKGSGLIRLGGNNIDTLIAAPSKNLWFFGTNNINKYLSANTPACTGPGEFTANDNEPDTLKLAAGIVLNINNLYMKNINVAGAAAPISFTGADGDNNTGVNITSPATGTTLYWVGGSGDWNDNSHWSATSGGTGGYCVPFNADNVVFDANSFTSGGNTVTTSGNAWCKNMTWSGVTNAPIFNESGSFILEVWGNLVLDPTVTMNAGLVFKGPDANTITSNGAGLGTLSMDIIKTMNVGSITMTDNYNNPNSVIRFTRGGFTVSGKTMNINSFLSNATGTRQFDFSNSVFTVSTNWTLAGTGRTWVAPNISVTSNGIFYVDALTYSKVYLTSGTALFDIFNTQVDSMVFTNTSTTSSARIGSGNNITNLVFKGAGGFRNNNNVITNLVLAPSMNYFVNGNQTINGSLSFTSPACSGLGEMRGYAGTTGVLNFGPAATVNVSNMYLQNMTAAGSVTPIAVSGADAGGNTGWNITSQPGSSRYWVGGKGDWNDNSHWSLTSGGAGGACVPTVEDDVFFDANSFLLTGDTVSTSGNVYCHNMDWTGATKSPVFNENATLSLEVWGNLVMNPAVTMIAEANFMGNSNATLTPNNTTLGNFDMIINKSTGTASLTIAGNLNNNQTRISLQQGTLNAANLTLNLQAFTDETTTKPTALNIANSTITAPWAYMGSNKTLTATGSVLNANVYNVNGGQYNEVNVTTTNAPSISTTTINKLTFTLSSSTSNVQIGAGNTIGRLEYKGRGTIAGTGNTIDTLIFAPGKQYILTAGTNTTIRDGWYGSGTPCNLTEISSSSTSNATVTTAAGALVDLDYIRLKSITGAGAASLTAREHSIDQGSNTGWNIAPYNGAAPIYGLGPDTTIAPTAFPYTITTEGFFGSPLSQYTWNNNSTLDHLVISTPGTYSVTVGFADGCSISDAITILSAVPLPVTLTSFGAQADGCDVNINWTAADAVSFSHFEVERSTGASNVFAPVQKVAYEAGNSRYTATDKEAGTGTRYYRLKMVDIDGRYSYSKTVAVRTQCTTAAIQVCPTLTSGLVNMVVPAGDAAPYQVSNAFGQIISKGTAPAQAQTTIDLSGQPSGTYMITVIRDFTAQSFKVTKQ